MRIKASTHLTPTERKIIRFMLENNEKKAGTKNISIKLEPAGENKYTATFYKYCAPALLHIGMDLRPEMHVPRWNYAGEQKITVS